MSAPLIVMIGLAALGLGLLAAGLLAIRQLRRTQEVAARPGAGQRRTPTFEQRVALGGWHPPQQHGNSDRKGNLP